jgi:hypothetical protein
MGWGKDLAVWFPTPGLQLVQVVAGLRTMLAALSGALLSQDHRYEQPVTGNCNIY